MPVIATDIATAVNFRFRLLITFLPPQLPIQRFGRREEMRRIPAEQHGCQKDSTARTSRIPLIRAVSQENVWYSAPYGAGSHRIVHLIGGGGKQTVSLRYPATWFIV